VTHCGRICVGRRKINLSQVFAGQIVGIREVDDQIWLVRFSDQSYRIPYADLVSIRFRDDNRLALCARHNHEVQEIELVGVTAEYVLGELLATAPSLQAIVRRDRDPLDEAIR
jgi:hypothetical protein